MFLLVICRYMGFQDENGHYIPEYFELLAIRLTFVIVFEVSFFYVSHKIGMFTSWGSSGHLKSKVLLFFHQSTWFSSSVVLLT